MALFSRSDRTFNLELFRDRTMLVERLHVGNTVAQRTDHPDEHAALVGYRRRFAAVVEEGWHLVLHDDDIGRPVACDPAIEAAISADDGEQLAVYADWLIERGDPCGELAALRARAERDPDPALTAASTALERERADDIFGVYAGIANHEWIELGWTHGWVTSLDVGPSAQAPPYRHHPESKLGTLVAIALLAPIARFVRQLNFLRVHTSDVRSVLATSPRRESIRRLEVTSAAHCQELFDALPRLEHIAMPAGSPEVRGHPNVTSLALSGSGEPGNLELLFGDWPALHTISIECDHEISAALAMLGDLPLMKALRVLAIKAPLETPIIRVLREAHPHLEITT